MRDVCRGGKASAASGPRASMGGEEKIFDFCKHFPRLIRSIVEHAREEPPDNGT